MRIEQVEMFIEASKRKSVSKAAAELHISHQALNAAIKSMESEIGFLLLERSYKGSFLTPEGEQFVRGMNKILAEYYMLLDQIKGCSTTSRSYTAGITYGLLEAFLSKALAEICSDPSFCELQYVEMPECHLLHALLEKKIDFGFVSYGSYESPEWLTSSSFMFTPIFSSRLYVRVSERSALAQYDSLSLKTILNKKILLYQPKDWENYYNPVIAFIRRFCPECIIETEPNYLFHHEKLIKGLGVAFGFSSTHDPKIKAIPIRENINITVGILMTPGTLSAEMRYFINSLSIALTVR